MFVVSDPQCNYHGYQRQRWVLMCCLSGDKWFSKKKKKWFEYDPYPHTKIKYLHQWWKTLVITKTEFPSLLSYLSQLQCFYAVAANPTYRRASRSLIGNTRGTLIAVPTFTETRIQAYRHKNPSNFQSKFPNHSRPGALPPLFVLLLKPHHFVVSNSAHKPIPSTTTSPNPTYQSSKQLQKHTKP